MICEKCNKTHDGTFGSGRFCSQSCASSRGPRSQATKDKISKSVKESIANKPTQVPWNKGKQIVERVTKKCPECKKIFETTLKANTKYCSKKCFLINAGGYREGAGRGDSGWYKDYYCDSSWELAYVIYNLDHNINFRRNTEKFEYKFNNKIHFYIPDFIVDEEFVEIKGYISEQWKAKLVQFKKPIKVLYEADMRKYFDYVISKYGNNYVEMYDNYKPKYTYKCSGCGIKLNQNIKKCFVLDNVVENMVVNSQ